MQLNTDFNERVVMPATDSAWVPSPAPGVERRMLFRDGEEIAVATSLVRYAPGCSFPAHIHDKGEEYLVLDGVFSDEDGHHAAGTYVRNPPGSSHAPFTEEGATILVSLRQFQDNDDKKVVVDSKSSTWTPGLVEGLSVLPLHTFGTEHVALVRWAPGTVFKHHQHWGGEEIYVIEGELSDEYGHYPAGTWLRSPHGSSHEPWSEQGALIYVRVGHLASAH